MLPTAFITRIKQCPTMISQCWIIPVSMTAVRLISTATPTPHQAVWDISTFQMVEDTVAVTLITTTW